MGNNITELVFILDRSGSMHGLERETIGGYNALLDKQKALPGDAVVTTVLFDNAYELLHDRIDIRAIRPITDEEYYVRGCTALLDALGQAIGKIATAQKNTAPEYRAGKVIFAITTDGLENASRMFSLETVRAMVERQQEAYGWEFLFLGANMDAISVAGQMGIRAQRAANVHADNAGVATQYEAFSDILTCMRAGTAVADNWQDNMEQAYRKRTAE